MAFNFNWSPLMADASFYTRAQDLLTAALNKSPKPPIIVHDITVTELNLGSIPPELEILEVGDLAEDRFRGIFKMSYTGDAFLTLKTRVQSSKYLSHNTPVVRVATTVGCSVSCLPIPIVVRHLPVFFGIL
jgi:distribution and morphology protein 34